jgi:hypothetical protein
VKIYPLTDYVVLGEVASLNWVVSKVISHRV